MSSGLNPEGVPPGAPVVPQGPVPAVGVPNSQDYPRLVYTAPRFEVVAIADIIEPSVLEACEALLPTLVPPYVNQAAIDAVNATAVRRAGDTMTGPLNLSPVIPTADAMAASKQYVDTMIATGAVPEVPPVPSGQAWARETGQWVPIAGGGTVTNIATGAGLTGGPITSAGTIAMANMNGNTLKGNNTGAATAPTDLNVGQVMAMLGAAPLNSPTFTGSPSLPTGTAAVTQPGGTSDSTVATTAFVTQMVNASAASALQLSGGTMTGPIVLAGNAAAALNPVPLQQLNTALAGYAPIASPVFTGSPSLPAGSFGVTQTAGTSNTSLATTAFVGAAITASAANYLPITGGTLAGPGNLTARGGVLVGAAGTVAASGALTLNANTVAPPAGLTPNLYVVGADGGTPTVAIDNFGASDCKLVFRAASGTAAAPTGLVSGQYIAEIRFSGYTSAGAYNAYASLFASYATETWSGTAQGSNLILATTPTGTATPVNSLILQGNTATFSGTVSGYGGVNVNGTAANQSPAFVIWDHFGSIRATWQFFESTGQLQITNTSPGPNSSISLPIDGSFVTTAATAVKPGGGPWTAPSDPRIKQDTAPYSRGLDAVIALKPITFKYNGEGGSIADGKTYVGLDASETEAVMPEMIGTYESADLGPVKTLDATALTFALVNAVAALNARLTALETPATV